MRPDAQLFLHVLGAVALFGASGAAAVFALAAGRTAERAALARATLLTTMLVAVPAWALMLVFGSWTKSKEGLAGSVGWIGLGNGIANGGIAVLLATSGLAYWWLRRPSSSWQPAAIGVISTAYVLALGVAWWAMSAKVPS